MVLHGECIKDSSPNFGFQQYQLNFTQKNIQLTLTVVVRINILLNLHTSTVKEGKEYNVQAHFYTVILCSDFKVPH